MRTFPEHMCPGTPEEFVRVHLPITDLPGVGVECVLAKPIGDGRFRIENFPFLHPEVRYGDLVTATPQGTVYEFTGIVEECPNGNAIIGYTGGRTAFERIAAAVRERGGMIEGAQAGTAGVNAPPNAWERVLEVLRREVTMGSVEIIDAQGPLSD